MKHITLAELNDQNGFFDIYAETKKEHFNELFPDIPDDDKQALNYLLTDVYGDRVILSHYEKLYKDNGSYGSHYVMTRIVNACDVLFFKQWQKIQQTIIDGYKTDIINPLSEKRNTETDRQGTDGSETQDKTNAFNDSENASDTDSTATSGTHAETIGTTETITKSNGKTASENAKKLINFARENDFLEMMLSDIVAHCTIAIM
jgi:hypothetical protein